MKPLQILALAFSLALLANAQNITGTVAGRVTDPGGAVIAGSTLTLVNVETNLTIPGKSSSNGDFEFSKLQPGRYQLSAQMQGFQKFETEVFNLEVDQTQRVDIALKIGDVNQSVTVLARTVEVDSESSSLGEVVGTQEIANLPMNGNNPMIAAELVPGFQPLTSFGNGLNITRAAAQMSLTANFSANGSVSANNEILLDGVPMTVCCQGQPVLIPTADTVAEVKVQTNSYTPEFGRTSGGVLNIVTKSGTNLYHGSAYEFFQNDQLDAANFFTNRTGIPPIPGRNDFRGPLRFNQFGASLGGPLDIPRIYKGKNKTFFFANWQATYTRTANFNTAVVPPTATRTGNFSQEPFTIYDPSTVTSAGVRSPFPNNMIPVSRISPVSTNILTQFFPQPQIAGVDENYSWTASTVTNDNQGSLRMDHNFNDANRFFARFSTSVDDYSAPDWTPNGPTGNIQDVDAHTYVMDYVKVLSANQVLDFRYSFAQQRNINVGNSILYNASSLGFSQNFLNEQNATGTLPGLPTIAIDGYRSVGTQKVANWDHYTHALGANYTWMHGSHTLKAGWDGRMFIDNEYNFACCGSLTFSGIWTQGPTTSQAMPIGSQPYYAMADYLLGWVNSGSMEYEGAISRSQFYNAFYFQDVWRVNAKLTVNYGLRYEIETGFHELGNDQSTFNPNVLSPISAQVSAQLGRPLYGAVEFAGQNGNPSNLWATNYDPGPRIGIAYAINPKTVIRSGFGIMFFPTTQRAYIIASSNGYSETTSVVPTINSLSPIANIANPFPAVALPTGSALGTSTGFGTNLDAGLYNVPNSYSEQWNVGVQRELGDGIVAQVSYAGGHGVKLPITFDSNNTYPEFYFPPGDKAGVAVVQATSPNPFYGIIGVGTQDAKTASFLTLHSAFPQYESSMQLQYVPWGWSTYHALQASAAKSMRDGLAVRAAFTWSKTLSDVNNLITSGAGGEGNASYQNAYTKNLEKAVSTANIPFNLVLNGTYELPYGTGRKFGGSANRFMQVLFGGWQTNATFVDHSGLPLQLTDTGEATYGGTRPNYTSLNPQLYTTGSLGSRLGGISGGPGYLNSSALSLTTYFQFGNVPRVDSNFIAPEVINLNAALNKYFQIHERMRLQFRCEIFNPLNHPIFSGPAVQFGAAGFGEISSQLNTPRNVQLALKLLW